MIGGGGLRYLEARVDSLEKLIDSHMRECAEIGRENLRRTEESLRRQDEIMKASGDNARACIDKAESVRNEMQRTFLRVAAATIAILIGAIELMAKFHT